MPLILPLFLAFGAVSLLFKLVTLWQVNLPVALWEWDAQRSEASWFWTCLYGPLVGFLLLGTAWLAFDGRWMALPLAFDAYLTLCGRAVRVWSGRQSSRVQKHLAR